MDDSEFAKAFHQATLPNEEFRHQGHLRLAWLVLRKHNLDEATICVTNGIKEYATAKSAADMYNETLTRFWLKLVDHTLKESMRTIGFQELLQRFPLLLDKQLPLKHWTQSVLMGSEARQHWVQPDLQALPF